MNDPSLQSAIPVLPVADVPKAVAFYRDRLGFTPLFEYGPYAGVGRGSIEVHLDGGAAGQNPVTCRFNVSGVDEIYADLEKQRVIHPSEPLETKPWGMRQFSALDCDGNRLTFAQPVSQQVSTPMLKLYGLTRSRALRCIWMLYELDVPFELVRVSPESAEFPLDVNPNRKIPALVDGATVMWESMAINLYLAQTRTSELSPRGRAELGDALKWTLWAQSELEEFFNKTGSLDEVSPEWMNKTLGVLETTLSGREYLMADRFYGRRLERQLHIFRSGVGATVVGILPVDETLA